MFSAIVLMMSVIGFIVGCIIVGGNLFPFEWQPIKIGLMLVGFSIFGVLAAAWGAND